MKIYFLTASEKISLANEMELAKYSDITISDNTIQCRSIRNKLFYLIQKKENAIYFSNSIKNFRHYTELILDDELIFFMKNVGFLFAPYTVFKNIYRIPNESKLIINKEKQELNYERMLPSIKNNKLDIEKFEKTLERTLISKSTTNNCILHGGGADSSLLLAIAKKNQIKCNSLTCEMTGMEEQAILAKQIADNLNIDNKLHRVNPESVKEILTKFIKNNYEPVSDPIMPVIREMLLSVNNTTIIDGQGADSLLLAVPQARLMSLYSPILSILLRIPAFLLKNINIDKSTKFGRKFYRIKKLIQSLSAGSIIDCLLTSWDFPFVKNSIYLSFVRKEIRELFDSKDDKFKILIYIYLNMVLPVREMQKYEDIDTNTNITLNLPFLDDDLIRLVYHTDTKYLFDGRNIKIPVYKLLSKEIPGFIKKNNTKPFFVKYFNKEQKRKQNLYRGKMYKITDLANFDFMTYNIDTLKSSLKEK
ncbi:MAG: asparagine synthase-related protein [Bacteroidota bacterium]